MKNNQQRYLEIDGEQIAVTEEVYLAYMRPIWAEQKQREREGRCRDENGNRCMGDCSLCHGDRDGRPVSLDKFSEDGFDIASSVDVQLLVENMLLSDALHASIDALAPDNRQIVGLFSVGSSEREIAVQVGLSQRGVNKRKHMIFEQLKKDLEIF